MNTRSQNESDMTDGPVEQASAEPLAEPGKVSDALNSHMNTAFCLVAVLRLSPFCVRLGRAQHASGSRHQSCAASTEGFRAGVNVCH